MAFPKWLTKRPFRNQLWVEHDGPPLKAIQYWGAEDVQLEIYLITDDGQMVLFTPQEVLDEFSRSN